MSGTITQTLASSLRVSAEPHQQQSRAGTDLCACVLVH